MSENIINEEYDIIDINESDLDSLETLEETSNLETSEEDSNLEVASADSIEESEIDVQKESKEDEDVVNETEDFLATRRQERSEVSEMEISEEETQHPTSKMEDTNIEQEVEVQDVAEEVAAEEIVAEETDQEVVAEEIAEEETDEVVSEQTEEIEESDSTEEIEEAKKSTKESDDSDEEEEDDEEEDDEEDSDDSDEEEEEDDEEVAEKKVKKEDKFVVDTDDIKRLIESEEQLTEGFKAKAALIFEAEVRTKVAEAKEEIQAQYEEKLAEQVEEINTNLSEQIDDYLTYAVSEWVKENEVAIENSLRTSIAEDFMASLKTLFVENYIEVPESKVDLFDELERQSNQLEEDLNKTKAVANELADKVDELTREKIIAESCEGLVETQVVKLQKLVESIDFEGEENFRENINVLKDFYFKGEAEVISEETEEEEDKEFYSSTETIVEDTEADAPKVSKTMEHYLNAIGRAKKLDE